MFSEIGLKHVVRSNFESNTNVLGELIETLEHHQNDQALYISMTSEFPIEEISSYVPGDSDQNALNRIQTMRCFYLSEIVDCFDLMEQMQYVIIQDLEAVYRLGTARNYSEAQSLMIVILRRLRKLSQKGSVAVVYDTEVLSEQPNGSREFINSLYDETSNI